MKNPDLTTTLWCLGGWLPALALLFYPAPGPAQWSALLLGLVLCSTVALELVAGLAAELELQRTSTALALFAMAGSHLPLAAGMLCGLLGVALTLLLRSPRPEHLADSGRALLPLVAAGAVALWRGVDTLSGQLQVLEAYLLVGLLLACRSRAFHQDILLVVVLPTVALAMNLAAAVQPGLAVLYLPLLFALTALRGQLVKQLWALRDSLRRTRRGLAHVREQARELKRETAVRGQLLSRKDRQLELLDTLSQGLSEIDQTRALCRLLLEKSLEIVAADGGFVWCNAQAAASLLNGGETPAPRLPESIDRVARANGQLFSDPGWRELGSHIMVPLGGMGVMHLGRIGPEPYPDFLEEFFAVIGRQAGAALLALERLEQVRQSHADLRASQDQLVESSQWAAAGRLAANAAHELNTPLGAIKLSAETALAFLTGPPPATDSLGLILKSVERCQRVTDRLLLYSRPAEARPAESFSITSVLSDSLSSLQPYLRQKRVELENQIDEDFIVQGGTQDCYWALTNVIKNAIDALADDQPRRLIRLTATPQDGRLAVRVDDNGPGVAPEQAEKVFEPFFSTKKIGQGNGLGLAISRQNLRAAGGELSLEPSQLGGACFCLSLPLEPGLG
ncbi:MAG: ATP-binding protein [Vulcanimicrobiota bacterium]